MSPGPVLRLEEVTVRYQGATRLALDRCTLSLDRGERLALLGLNGSGKTTLLLVAGGLVPFSGQAEVAGLVVGEERIDAIRRRIGFLFAVPDDQILFPRVIDDVVFSATRGGSPRDQAIERALEVLTRLGIAELAPENPQRLSHGQRLRVALAGALVGQPDLLLLDEPSAMLDPPARARLGELLRELPPAMVIAAHDLGFVRRACTHFALLEQGRLSPPRPIAEMPADLFSQPDPLC